MSRQRTLSRLHVLEVRNPERRQAAMVARVAKQYGVDEAEIWEETKQIAEELQRLGLVTFEEQLAHVAGEMGISVEELQAEIDEMMAACP